MKPQSYARRLAVLLLVAAIMLVALSFGGGPGFTAVAVVVVWFFFAAVETFPAPSLEERLGDLLPPVVPIFAPRPPPVR